jgi:hypothetical protein
MVPRNSSDVLNVVLATFTVPVCQPVHAGLNYKIPLIVFLQAGFYIFFRVCVCVRACAGSRNLVNYLFFIMVF